MNEPDPPGKEIEADYRRLGAGDASRPGEAVRRRVLDYAAQLASERGAPAPAVPLRMPPRAARWRPTVYGTLAAAALAVLVMAPLLLHRSAVAPSPPLAYVTTSATQAPPALAPAEGDVAVPPQAPSGEGAATGASKSSGKARSQVALQGVTKVRAAGGRPSPPASPSEKATAYRGVAPAIAGAPKGAADTARAASSNPAPLLSATIVRRAPTALHLAAEQGDLARVEALLEEGTDIDARDARDRTALMSAVNGAHLDVVTVLLEHGANPNLADAVGTTPLQLSLQIHNADIIAQLRKYGAH